MYVLRAAFAIGLFIFLVPALVLAEFSLTEQSSGVVSYKKGYVDGPFGQIHYHRAQPLTGTPDHGPVVLFHQGPQSAASFDLLLKALGTDRIAVAFDTPGYGESDGPDEPLTIRQLSDAMAQAINGLHLSSASFKAVDVLGFRTGATIAVELAVAHADLVRRVTLSDIFYGTDERAKGLARLDHDFKMPEDGTHILKTWHIIVTKRATGVTFERSTRRFLETLHPLERYLFAFDSVFRYPIEDRLPMIKQPVLIIQPHDFLLSLTRTAQREALPNATMVELPDVREDVFETGADRFAETMKSWLDHSLVVKPVN